MKRRLLAVFLAFALCLGLMPLKASAYSVLSGKHGWDFADGELANRLETIFYSGISGCVSPSIPAVGGSLNNSQGYTTTFANQSGSSTDWQCQAYSRAAYSYLFGYNLSNPAYQSEFRGITAGKNSVSYDLFQQLGVKCGAYMRTTPSSAGDYNPGNGHSIIILAYNSSGITTLEGNYNGGGKIGILNYSWADFNAQQLSGRGRYICGFAQPSEAVYASVGYEHGGPAGKTSLPSVSVNGRSVTVSWTHDRTASSYDVYLIQEPWAWEDIRYHISTQAKSCTFENVAEGTYRAFTIARPNDDYTQSEWAEFTVAQAHFHTWDNGVVTTEPTVHKEGVRTYTCTGCGATQTETIDILTSYTIPYGTTEIKDYEFQDCKKLTSITVPGTVTKIGRMAFYGCTSLTSVVIPDSVTMIGDNAFSDCTSLTSVVIPDSVTTIGGGAFYGCASLTSVVIPDSVTEIGDSVFMDCTSLTSIVIPDSVTEIGDGVFMDCTSLTSVVIPDRVITIGDHAFYGCTSLTSVVIPDRVTTIGGGTFYRCASLTSIVIPDGVTMIGDNAFYGCTSLASVVIPDSVAVINWGAFWGCTNLTDVYYGGTQEQWKKIQISPFNSELREATIHFTAGTCTTHTYDSGVVTKEPTFDSEGVVTYTCVVCGELKKELIPKLTETFFADAQNTGSYYYQPVMWAVKSNITSGTSATTFSPERACSRKEIVTFLWRAAGSPEPKTTANPFTDVRTGAYYDKAVRWALENGVTTGTSSTTFSPDASCTRWQVVTFLWRAMGRPETAVTSQFTDVPASAAYAQAVAWAVSRGITTGTSPSTFSPNNVCNRAQIVTFLYRAYH